MTVAPLSSARVSIIFSIRAAKIGSSPAVGLSSNKISGLSNIARANPTRFCIPLPNCPIRIRWVSFPGAPSDREQCAIRSIMTTFDPIAQLSFSCAIRSSVFVSFSLEREMSCVALGLRKPRARCFPACTHRVCACACAPLIGCTPRDHPITRVALRGVDTGTVTVGYSGKAKLLYSEVGVATGTVTKASSSFTV